MKQIVISNAKLHQPTVRGSPGGRAPTSTKFAFSLLDSIGFIAGVVVATWVGAAAHRWMWTEAQLLNYRSTMQALATTVRATQFRAHAQDRTFELRVDASSRRFQLITVMQQPGGSIERVERTIWLPEGLQISEAPEALRALPTGRLSSASIVVLAPAYNRLFRLRTSETEGVELHEEPSL